MKKATLIGIYTIYPLVLVVIYTLLSKYMYHSGDGFYHYSDNEFILFGFFAVCYAFPFCGFYYFAKKRPFNQWLLFVGFTLVPAFSFIYEYLDPPSNFQYLNAIITTVLYAIPFIIISLIFALVISIKDRRKK